MDMERAREMWQHGVHGRGRDRPRDGRRSSAPRRVVRCWRRDETGLDGRRLTRDGERVCACTRVSCEANGRYAYILYIRAPGAHETARAERQSREDDSTQCCCCQWSAVDLTVYLVHAHEDRYPESGSRLIIYCVAKKEDYYRCEIMRMPPLCSLSSLDFCVRSSSVGTRSNLALGRTSMLKRALTIII